MTETSSSESYQASAHFRLRLLRDRLARYAVAAGGNGVIVAILLIFIYLLYVVLPLIKSPEMHQEAQYPLAVSAPVEYLAMEEQAEIGIVVDQHGLVRFLSTRDGSVVKQSQLPVPAGVTVDSFSAARPNSGVLALGLSNGQALVFKPTYTVTFPNDQRLITPGIVFPLGKPLVTVNTAGQALKKVAVQASESYTLAGWSADGTLSLLAASAAESLLADEGGFEFTHGETQTDAQVIASLLIDPTQTHLYIVGEDGTLAWYDITSGEGLQLHEQIDTTPRGVKVIDANLLSGGNSIMVASDDGKISQWFSVRGDGGVRHLKLIRSFAAPANLTSLSPEFSRKGFVVGDDSGGVGVYHATAHHLLLHEAVADAGIKQLAIGPRANALWVLDRNNRLHFWRVSNEHPEVSWESLWSKVWYEGYDEPAYIWQSSSADNEFEPKFSLTPLTFGTLKAAFYAMLFAIPLSLLGAIFTAYFMAPKMRQIVKPSIEIMEAMPTVILGFLAGLWLAPLVESHLAGIFLLFMLLPPAVLLSAYLWHRLPVTVRGRIPEGWEAALLIPVVVLTTWFALGISPMVEYALFAGDMPHWLQTRMGIGFDQRNSLVVGMAMGFAVIPTIFSIAEDAIFAVPKHLTNGSLALGATPWQTLVRVVLLTASPGLFSAVMMGVGRAVGETMIVLMATGNTPVMDMSIFQGMRTLSANIAVEMPESEVNSTHYRVLFLAALVLFLFTFVFNTGAELIRQRLRAKYSSL
jgi:phosphate transport system permease protein